MDGAAEGLLEGGGVGVEGDRARSLVADEALGETIAEAEDARPRLEGKCVAGEEEVETGDG